ncbi:hypothetical protein, partial [Herbaspirillum aquaticum]|uniref:hypothetical protein n=1 Tax=Herbaspirillum aquaticum TaxID=568783 RepID=UPI0024DE66E2
SAHRAGLAGQDPDGARRISLLIRSSEGKPHPLANQTMLIEENRASPVNFFNSKTPAKNRNLQEFFFSPRFLYSPGSAPGAHARPAGFP